MNKYYASKFYVQALEQLHEITEQEELLKIDQTQALKKEISQMIRAGEIININIGGLPGTGKSTVGMAIAQDYILNELKQEMKISNIARDQQEFSKMMRNPQLNNTCILIDEWNEMETTGENATVESALLIQQSDIQAQRFVHRVSCSPRELTDINASLLIEVVQPDKQKEKTYCHLYYRMMYGRQERIMTMGHLEVDVSTVLHKPWYEEYRRRKFDRFDLMNKEGIFTPRILNYIPIIKGVIEDNKTLTKLGMMETDKIKADIEYHARQHKIPLSILGKKSLISDVVSYLILWKVFYRIQNSIKKLEKTKAKSDLIEYDLKMEALEKAQKQVTDQIALNQTRLEKMEEIAKKYA